MDNSPNIYGGINRRKYPRLNGCVEYSILNEVDAKKTTDTKNISAGGVAFFAKDKLEVNTILSLSIGLPDMSDFQAKARVVWCAGVQPSPGSEVCYELGIEFVEIDENDRQRISKYVFLRLDNS